MVAEKDIPEKIRDKNKKIGSTKQKTINIYKVYGSRQLIFKDEAEELKAKFEEAGATVELA